MRISDWSSDVCSSDLLIKATVGPWHQALKRLKECSRTFCLQRPIGPPVPCCEGSSRGEAALSKPFRTDCRLKAIRRLQPADMVQFCLRTLIRSEEHTSELQSLMRISYAVFCLNNKQQAQTP